MNGNYVRLVVDCPHCLQGGDMWNVDGRLVARDKHVQLLAKHVVRDRFCRRKTVDLQDSTVYMWKATVE